jgi:hypothetical protein
MPDLALHVPDLLAGVALIPGAVELFGRPSELHEEVARQVLRLGLASFLAPKLHKGRLVAAHDDPGVGAADEKTALRSRNVRESNFAF